MKKNMDTTFCRHLVLTAAAVLPCYFFAGCINVPPKKDPPENARKATATVDHQGRTIVGGNLTLEIPAGALNEGEQIKVTIDRILGAPAQHISEAYLVNPENQDFLQPVTVSYKYSSRDAEQVIDQNLLFVGTAVGSGWQALSNHEHNVDGRIVKGKVTHFSVFGLVDPLEPVDGGMPDATRIDARLADTSIPADVTSNQDTTSQDTTTPLAPFSVELTWEGATSDLDLHLLLSVAGRFTDDDCYYGNCKHSSLEWPPAGEVGNPKMDVDDLQGHGPEIISMQQPTDGTYIAAVHAYSLNSDTVPMGYKLRVYHDSQLELEVSRQLAACNDFVPVLEIVVSDSGRQVSATERPLEVIAETHGTCS